MQGVEERLLVVEARVEGLGEQQQAALRLAGQAGAGVAHRSQALQLQLAGGRTQDVGAQVQFRMVHSRLPRQRILRCGMPASMNISPWGWKPALS